MSTQAHALRRNNRRYRLGDNVPFAAFHSTVADWATRVVTNGGAAPSDTTKYIFTTFMNSLDSGGITSKMLGLNLFAPDSLIAAITPLIKGTGNDPWTNVGSHFVGGDLTVNGLTGDASTKVLNTGLIPNNIFTHVSTVVSAGISIYNYTLGTVASGMDVGASSNVASAENSLSAVFTPTSDNHCYYDYSNNSGGRVGVTNTGFKGFTSGNNTDSTHNTVYQASSVVPFATLGSNSTSVAGNGISSQPFSVFGYTSAAGTPTANSNRTLSFAAIHLGLSSSEAQTLYNAVQACRVSLGGGFI